MELSKSGLMRIHNGKEEMTITTGSRIPGRNKLTKALSPV
jgi:hypothetical protein